MNHLEWKERFPHRALVDLSDLDWLSVLPGHVVPAFSVVYQFEQEYADVAGIELIQEWRRRMLNLAVSVKGRGRSDILGALTKSDEEPVHRDVGTIPKKRGILPKGREPTVAVVKDREP